ncbi:hypothetical protein BJY01DRAFT_252982 [Aspergillus pseudoustus]|uniref:Uncharacterized protein n=1 Tax=Aspergillus pseudoustus TaxID=1810923 RepID=A0ABR4J6I9_9EURO
MERLRGILQRLPNCRHLTLDPDGLFGWKGDALHSLAEAIAILLNTMTDVGRELHKLEIREFPASPSDGVSSRADELQVLTARMSTPEGRLVWSGLHRLAIGFNIADHGLEDFVIKALEHSRRLSDLELNGYHGGLTEGLMKRMVLAASGCRLTRLEFLSARCATDDFRVFLDQHHRTLRTFIFKSVHLHEGGWVAVLKDLSAGFPALRGFELAWMKEDSPGKSFVDGMLRFPGLAEDVTAAEQQGWRFPWVGRWGNEPAGPQALGWSGPGVHAALERLVHCAVTKEP